LSSRLERVADLLMESISEILEHRLRDPRKGMITVTGVKVSPDLRHAQIYVTTLGDEAAKRESLRLLAGATGFIRAELARRVNLRYVPELLWRADDSVEYGQRIDALLREIQSEREARGEAPPDAGAGEPDSSEEAGPEEPGAPPDGGPGAEAGG
jgi:ribosome-binding factor A